MRYGEILNLKRRRKKSLNKIQRKILRMTRNQTLKRMTKNLNQRRTKRRRKKRRTIRNQRPRKTIKRPKMTRRMVKLIRKNDATR